VQDETQEGVHAAFDLSRCVWNATRRDQDVITARTLAATSVVG
jgi:hypothetical protein